MEEDFYITLIYRQLNKELQPGDVEQLEAWLKEDPANETTADKIRKAWALSENLRPKMEVDLNEEFAALESLMDEEEASQKTEEKVVPKIQPLHQPKSRYRRYLPLVASFLVLVLIGALLYPRIFKQNELLVQQSGASSKELKLPDGSIVRLNKNSKLSYPRTFEKGARVVALSGTAFFEVKHDPEQAFIIKTSRDQIQVLGTQFEVQESNEQTSVYVFSGRVQMSLLERTEYIVLEKNEKGIADPNGQNLEKLANQAPGDLAWFAKRYNFVDAPLSEVFKAIELTYGVQFQYSSQTLKDCKFNYTKEVNGLQEMIGLLMASTGLEIESTDQIVYTVEGEGCY